MQGTSETGIMTLLKDTITLEESTGQLLTRYKSARPFPHLVLDGLFSAEMLEELVAEIPSMDGKSWVHHNEKHLTKSNLRSAVELGKTGQQYTAFLHSAAFLYLISEMTGIWGLVPDPYLGGSGYHIVPAGGKFDVHADRNIDHTTGLTRRIAMITYLNKGWTKEDGGQLELWNADGSKCEVVVEPLFNRTIIFEVGDKNFHGVQPVLCADGRVRRSFAVYFHTVGGAETAPHSSIYAPSFYISKKMVLRELAEDVAPPILLRLYRRLRSKKY